MAKLTKEEKKALKKQTEYLKPTIIFQCVKISRSYTDC